MIFTVVSLEVDHGIGKIRQDILQIETIKTDIVHHLIEISTMTIMVIRTIEKEVDHGHLNVDQDLGQGHLIMS